MNIITRQPLSLFSSLVVWTLLFIGAQLLFACFHYQVSGLLGTLGSNYALSQLRYAVVIWPIVFFLTLQIAFYALFVAWLWFIANAYRELFHLSAKQAYVRGQFIWCLGVAGMLVCNSYFYPDSFFALKSLNATHGHTGFVLTWSILFLFFFGTLLAFTHFFLYKRFNAAGIVIFIFIAATIMVGFANHLTMYASKNNAVPDRPTIILIGLDSVRPDFTSSYDLKHANTPTIDAFLKSGMNFTHTYTPLARTFPSWVSILTGQHPVHSQARNNLNDEVAISKNDTLAKRLQAAGYKTLYASDEKRFSNITKAYGFDHLIGPKMGVDDFLIGGLSDFPLTNLMVNLPFGRYLLPYNYGNRAAAITYRPSSFLQLLKSEIPSQHKQPLLIAIHFCLSHWPYTWAQDGEAEGISNEMRYIKSVEGVDQTLKQTLAILQAKGLLRHAIVVLLSDHGTGLGLLGDRAIRQENYVGDFAHAKEVTVYQLAKAHSFTVNPSDFSLNTSYGQGTDVLSLQQYHVLFAIKTFGLSQPHANVVAPHSLLDITPTLLSWLKLPALAHVDGQAIINTNAVPGHPQFWETGDKFGAIETSEININKVIKSRLSMYEVNPQSGFLKLRPVFAQSLIENKQRAIVMGDWLLAYFPPHVKLSLKKSKLSSLQTMQPTDVPGYYVLLNLKTQKWTVEMNAAFAKRANVSYLMAKLHTFYAGEM